MGMGQPDRSRRKIAAGRSRIDTVDGRSECRHDRNCGDNCEDFQSDMGTSSVAQVEIVVHGQHLPRPESTQAREAGSTRVSPPTSDRISPSSGGHKDRSGGLYVTELHVTELPERRASAANIDATPSPTMMGPHPHEIVAIIIRIVRVGIGPADPEKGEIPKVVTVMEAPARHSAEACSGGHGSRPTCSKSAARGQTARGHSAVEGSAAVETAATAVETTATAVGTATAAVSATTTAATTATCGSIHRHRRKADCRNGRKADHDFPEHGTLLFKGVAPDNQQPICAG